MPGCNQFTSDDFIFLIRSHHVIIVISPRVVIISIVVITLEPNQGTRRDDTVCHDQRQSTKTELNAIILASISQATERMNEVQKSFCEAV